MIFDSVTLLKQIFKKYTCLINTNHLLTITKMCLESIIQLYANKALEHNGDNKACHMALLMSGNNKVISFGFNQMDRQCFRGKYVSSVHAEIDCLRKYRPIRDLMKRNYYLVIVKVAKSDKVMYHDSMPCKHCTRFLLGLNFRHVYCSNKDGSITKLNLNAYVPYNHGVIDCMTLSQYQRPSGPRRLKTGAEAERTKSTESTERTV